MNLCELVGFWSIFCLPETFFLHSDFDFKRTSMCCRNKMQLGFFWSLSSVLPVKTCYEAVLFSCLCHDRWYRYFWAVTVITWNFCNWQFVLRWWHSRLHGWIPLAVYSFIWQRIALLFSKSIEPTSMNHISYKYSLEC